MSSFPIRGDDSCRGLLRGWLTGWHDSTFPARVNPAAAPVVALCRLSATSALDKVL